MLVDGKLLKEQTSMIFSNALAANGTVIFVVGLFLAFAHVDGKPFLVLSVWAAAMVVVSLSRLFVYWKHYLYPETKTPKEWLKLYTLLTAAQGGTWAIPVFLIFIGNNTYNIVLVYVVLSATQMTAVPVLSVVKPMFYAYVLPSAILLMVIPMWVDHVPLYLTAGSLAWVTIVLVTGENLHRRMVRIFSLESVNQGLEDEIRKRRQVEDDLSYLAHHDALTNLPNRLLLDARLQKAIDNTDHYNNKKLAVLFIDLDNFKKVNDSLGHEVGDLLLREISVRLKHAVRDSDTVARLGGDEFIIVAEQMSDNEAIIAFLRKIRTLIDVPFPIQDNVLHVSFSVGVSVYPDDGTTTVELIKNADAAMYRAKDLGKNDYHFYTRDLTDVTLQRIRLEADLREALLADQLLVFYQIQICLGTNKISGVEALVRWKHPRLGLLTPDKFLSIAEESGLIVKLGEIVLYKACRQMVSWKKEGIDLGRVAVNLAGAQLRTTELPALVDKVFRSTGCQPEWLELEVLEDFLMHESTNGVAVLQQLKDKGVVLAIDDFGTGYSSLSRLKQLPINKLKIDKSFIRDLEHDPDDAAIVRAIIALARSLNLKVLAEGVENQSQVDLLLKEGCHQAQGFYYSKPVEAKQVWPIVESFNRSNDIVAGGCQHAF